MTTYDNAAPMDAWSPVGEVPAATRIARVRRQDNGAGWDVIFDGRRTGFSTERIALEVAAKFEAGTRTPNDYPYSHPVVDELDVIGQVQVAILKIAAEARVITAAQAFYRLSKTSVDPDSDIWFDHQRRLFDAVAAMDGAL